MTPEFWDGRRVLVTGHTGFKGSWLTLWLAGLGAKVTGYALAPPTEPNHFRLARVGAKVESLIGDVRNLDQMRTTVERTKPEVVFHLAAQSLVRESYRRPIDTLETNVMGTATLLEALRNIDHVRAVIVVTSDKCYENREHAFGYRESDAMGGHDPYSASKGAAELVVASFRRSFFDSTGSPAIATARAGNVIGGGDFAVDRLLPDCVRSIEQGVPIIIRHPHATRPWQFVLEPLAGYLSLAERLVQDGHSFAEAWNFGPDDNSPPTVHQVVTQFAANLRKRGARNVKLVHQSTATAPHEAERLRLDVSKARDRLNLRSVLSIDKALAITADWYAHYLDHDELENLTASQIAHFQSQLVGSDV